MTKNRLKLNFSLESAEERKNFLNSYLTLPQFAEKPLSNSELEIIANYLLWGKSSENPKVSLAEEASVELPRKNSSWVKKNPATSLDELQESPSFNEAIISSLTTGTQFRIKKEKFSREKIRKTVSPFLLSFYEDLWRRIDSLDLLISYYEFENGKRKNPPRAELLELFSKEEKNRLLFSSRALTQFTYLKRRHELISLRQEQFSFFNPYQGSNKDYYHIPLPSESEIIFDSEDFPVLPLGLFSSQPLARLIFQFRINPHSLTQSELAKISVFLQEKKVQFEKKFSFSFLSRKDVSTLLSLYFELEDAAERAENQTNLFSTTRDLLRTLNFYCARAKLTKVQRLVLLLKVSGFSNRQISKIINQKIGTSYSDNYISTIYHQKIIGAICAAAETHYQEIKNIFFPENFRTCNECGRVLLLNSDNFTKRNRSANGFSTKCKECEKRIRRKKQKEKETQDNWALRKERKKEEKEEKEVR